MRDRDDPWKWPFAVGLALALTAGLFLFLPDAWLENFSRVPGTGRFLPAIPPARWITLLPPPDIASEPDLLPEPLPSKETSPPEDPRWWSQGWQVVTGTAVTRDLRPTPADSVAVLLTELGVGLDFLQQVRPDSLLATRLALMQVEDSMRFDELKPYLSAMTRARAYADILSRAADMYGDFLQSKIMVPD